MSYIQDGIEYHGHEDSFDDWCERRGAFDETEESQDMSFSEAYDSKMRSLDDALANLSTVVEELESEYTYVDNAGTERHKHWSKLVQKMNEMLDEYGEIW